MPVLLPDLLYRDDAFYSDLGVEYDAATGRITRIGHHLEFDAGEATPLRGRALIPGFVNAHSHAFQRLIRGRMQWRPSDAGVANFWSWRQAMYTAALRLSPEDVYDVSRWCFVEMLRAGITTVGEFHYLHNASDGKPYEDRAELARRVIAAARDVGIRICLLNTCYAAGGIGRLLLKEQRRFETADVDDYLEMTERLAADMVRDRLVTVGVAPHSVRAVPREWIRVLHAWAATRDLPFHMHVSEQPAEIDECIAAFGVRPVEMLAEDMILDARFTAVHATHINDGEVQLLGSAGATVCACPTTERDLGDGFLRGSDLLAAGTGPAEYQFDGEWLDIGRPDQVGLVFDRRIHRGTKRPTPGRFRTRVITEGVTPSLHVDYKHATIKQYHKEGKALRTETTINNTRDFQIGKRLTNLPALREIGFSANRRLLAATRFVRQPCGSSVALLR